MKLWQETVTSCSYILDLRSRWQVKLRVLLFVFFPLFVKEWGKMPLDEEQDIFNSWHFKLGVEFPVFLSLWQLWEWMKFIVVSLSCAFSLPVHRRQLSTSGLSRPVASASFQTFPWQNQQRWRRTHSDGISSGMCWHARTHIHVVKIQSQVRKIPSLPVSPDAERGDVEFLHLWHFEVGCSCFIECAKIHTVNLLRLKVWV